MSSFPDREDANLPKVGCTEGYLICSVVGSQSSISSDNVSSDNVSSDRDCKQKFKYLCTPSYRWRWFGNKGVAILLVWSFAAFALFSYFMSMHVENTANTHKYRNYICISIGSIFFPVIGWLADVYVGRYRIIKSSLIIMWSGAFLLCVIYLVRAFFLPDSVSSHLVTSLDIVIAFALGCFQVNIIQFSIDQLLDASSSEIISYITWYVWTFFGAQVLIELMVCINKHYDFSLLVVTVLLSLCLFSDALFNHWLVKEPVTRNPLKLIFKVLQHAIRNKYPYQRSTFTYWNDEHYSRIDLAKNKYGGPFTTRQVEDVKTCFRIHGLLIIGCLFYAISIQCGNDIFSTFQGHHCAKRLKMEKCLEVVSVTHCGHEAILLFIPFYEFVLLPCFGKCFLKLRIFTRLSIGGVLLLIHLLGLISVEAVGKFANSNLLANDTQTSTCSDNNKFQFGCDPSHDTSHYWLVLLSSVHALGQYFVLAAGIEFICAQSPYSMKGMIFGSVYSCLGLSLCLMFLLLIPFRHATTGVVMGCVFWYLLTCLACAVVCGVIFSIASHCYKNRLRDNDD